MDYFVLWFKLDYRHQYTIWCTGQTNAPDQLYQHHGFIPVFDSLHALKRYADLNHIMLVEETPLLHDLDCVKVWLKTQHPKTPNDALLAAWNLFGDIAAIHPAQHLTFEALTQKHLIQYRKLFAVQNIGRTAGCVRPKYDPAWTKSDKKAISRICIYGFKLLRNSFRHQSNC